EARRPGQVLDQAFIAEHTDGLGALEADLAETSWEAIEEASGLSEQEIRGAGSAIAASERIIVCWAMGLTQHKNGVANVQSAVNLLLLKGSLGKPGAGVCPVRGHSNVQGDRTMGIWERPSEAFLDRLGAEFDFEPPREHGLNVVEAIQAMHARPGHLFVAMGGNFISATPDTEYTAEALRRCRLTVQVSTKLNRSHLVTGQQALILPCLGRTERDLQAGRPQFVTVENSMGVVHLSKGHLKPASAKLLSEPRIVARMARAALGDDDPVGWMRLADDYDRIREHIARVIPGFEDYNTRVLRPGGFVLPNPARDRVFRTATGKARFTVHPIPQHHLEPGELMMMTLRSHDQYNTTVYGHDDRYRGLSGNRRVVLMHQADIGELGLRPGQEVDLVSRAGVERQRRVAPRFVVVPYDIPRRCVATYFPEANILVPIDSYADRSFTPTSKSVVVTLERR
ncbi:MAG: molybdopterin dinucleotide binding domain-containing protein, partial [Myxococcota bacterium]